MLAIQVSLTLPQQDLSGPGLVVVLHVQGMPVSAVVLLAEDLLLPWFLTTETGQLCGLRGPDSALQPQAALVVS